MAYQICDDLLDETGASTELGKPSRQDARHGRSNYVAELGVEGAHTLAVSLVADAGNDLRRRFGDRQEVALLLDAAELILQGAGSTALSASSSFQLDATSCR